MRDPSPNLKSKSKPRRSPKALRSCKSIIEHISYIVHNTTSTGETRGKENLAQRVQPLIICHPPNPGRVTVWMHLTIVLIFWFTHRRGTRDRKPTHKKRAAEKDTQVKEKAKDTKNSKQLKKSRK